MDVMTLTGFLLARIAEDEAVAQRAVIPAHDGYKPHPDLTHWIYEEEGEVEYVQTPELLAHPYPDRLYVTCDGEGLTPSVTDDVGPHIARHDPARVLAECEAKRSLIDAAEDLHSRRFILEALAAVYSDHPDYDEAWRP